MQEYYNWAIDFIDRLAEDKTKLAMLYLDHSRPSSPDERNISFWNFKIKSNKVANLLVRLGCRKGDRLFLMLPNVPELWEIELGCMKLGVVYMPASTLLTSRDVAYRLNRSKAKIVIADSGNVAKIESVRNQCPTVTSFIFIDPEKATSPIPNDFRKDRDTIWLDYYDSTLSTSTGFVPPELTKSAEDHVIYFTSGTAGYPKMVAHSNVSYPLGHLTTGKYWLNLNATDLHWNISNPGWAKHAWSSMYAPWNCGAAVFVFNHMDRFTAGRHLEILEQYEITSFCAPPTAWRMLILEDLKRYNFHALRECVSAGEPLNPEVIHKWRENTGKTIREGYGQTETVCIVGTASDLEQKDGSMGKPMPGFVVSVINELGEELPPRTEGDIALRVKPSTPLGLMSGYVDEDGDLNQKIIRNGEWYITGDRAFTDEEGYFFFVGRKDDVIKSSGYRIGPFEVESAALEHPAVKESAAIGIPDQLRGNVVKLFVILKSNFNPSRELAQDIALTVGRITAPYKRPKVIEFVEELPKTISGKIKRSELRERNKETKSAFPSVQLEFLIEH
ncbi:MAG: acyl--CoA ligase [Nitrososphaerales archaeon]